MNFIDETNDDLLLNDVLDVVIDLGLNNQPVKLPDTIYIFSFIYKLNIFNTHRH